VAGIRALAHDDLPAVAALLRDHLGDDAPTLPFLAATLLDHPWADEETPSLVATQDGRVVGFLGVQARRLRLAGRAARGACCSHLVVAPDARATATGALLVRRCLAGPQDVTWSDSAIPIVARLWQTFGGDVDHARSCDWLLVLRPAHWAAAIARGRRASRDLVPVGALPAHALGRRLVRRAFPQRESGVAGETATPEAIVAALGATAHGLTVHVDYDAAQLTHLLELVAATAGPVRCRLVRRDREPIGWYAYVSRPGSVSRVLHVGARLREAGAVVADLVDDARDTGAAALAGRVEPALDDPLRERFAVLGYARLPVVHARDQATRVALGTARSVLSQLDGEWWIT
jgi:hypothetical protein